MVAFDISEKRIRELQQGYDRTGEVESEELTKADLYVTSDPAQLGSADFHIVTVPTPVTDARLPDLTPLLEASRTIGRALKEGAIVVYESTVYPGATEEDCIPVLEEVSGLTFGRDFTVGYSPERINPGDREHRFTSIQKVVAGSDPATAKIIAAVYGSIVKAGVYVAPSLKVAEAAKVIENTQRDINIALMNELAIIFNRLGIDTQDVLAAASTKWNFLPFKPGLVGGHCIGVDPYYLTHRAQSVGYHPEVILSGRRINDGMGAFVAHEVLRRLMADKRGTNRRVTVLGFTFKENVPDIRNTKVIDIVNELRSFGIEVQLHDPHADPEETVHEHGVTLLEKENLLPAGAIILAVAHDVYIKTGWDFILPLLDRDGGVVADIKGVLEQSTKPSSVELWRL
ncbi:UDP-glucose dehydrogenase [Caenispirillum salinarum AK4]|uniref:UDP-glucose dehydrogenase n=1 Tax=Caenispirillum salinarum AK4 TaxID=1238182 RepID=K9GIV0_9PROT|nr:UDP-glucose dehydrogenase [Caenispirillum salinarum AK4]